MQPSGLESLYLEARSAALAGQDDGCLLVDFGERCSAMPAAGYIRSGMIPLEPVVASELLRPAGAGQLVREADLLQLAGSDTLALAICVDEHSRGGLQAATREAYHQLLSAADRLGYPHLVRVWNYLADINRVDNGLERYQAFCIGRFEAFAEQGISDDCFPSACALGHAGGDLLVYLLASRVAPEHFENPSQVSAYRYPEQYGPRSPSFARGSLLQLPGAAPQLFVSGTASVVGHETRCVGDLSGQLQVTLDNLDQLLTHVRTHSDLSAPLVPELLKVYLRHPEDLARVQAGLQLHFGQVPALYVQADICRSDLLLEIDGVWRGGAR